MLTNESGADRARMADLPAPSIATVRDDDHIASQAMGALERENLLAGLRVELSVEQGWLTISGAAAHEVERSAAECVVRYVPGVRGVTNRLTVAMADRREQSSRRHR